MKMKSCWQWLKSWANSFPTLADLDLQRACCSVIFNALTPKVTVSVSLGKFVQRGGGSGTRQGLLAFVKIPFNFLFFLLTSNSNPSLWVSLYFAFTMMRYVQKLQEIVLPLQFSNPPKLQFGSSWRTWVQKDQPKGTFETLELAKIFPKMHKSRPPKWDSP